MGVCVCVCVCVCVRACVCVSGVCAFVIRQLGVLCDTELALTVLSSVEHYLQTSTVHIVCVCLCLCLCLCVFVFE